MNKGRMVTRRSVMVATGIAMATSLGLAGAGATSAAAPALKIKAGAVWTLEGNEGGPCEQEVFASNGTFSAATKHGADDAGTWSGGKSSIEMIWTAGANAGDWTYNGTFRSARQYFKGTFFAGPQIVGGKLLHKAVSGC